MKELRKVEVNGKEYRVEGRETETRIEALVFDSSNVKKGEEMSHMVEKKVKWAGLRSRDPKSSLADVMQQALAEAVEEVEQERLEREKIDDAMQNVKETYAR